MVGIDHEKVQGDLFSRGFPKRHESYYFFSIVKPVEFTRALALLASSGHISSLKKVLEDWIKIDGTASGEFLDITNALIGFSMKGLGKIKDGLGSGDGLELEILQDSDPAFFNGMAADELNDPEAKDLDRLFRDTSVLHGVLKVAANTPALVNCKLDAIKQIMGYPTIIADVPGKSDPTTVSSRVDGQVRPDRLKGHEHFGFLDGTSQPLMEGIDKPEQFAKDTRMQTGQNLIITSTKKPSVTGDKPETRPGWMIDGSFLVFRKLDQNVKKFNELVEKFASVGCLTAEHCAAKLMGRWKSGAPIVLFPNNDAPSDPTATNDFSFASDQNGICPFAAHIRKTNPRTGQDSVTLARIVRNGIPYGTEFSQHPDDLRGLLFACYQSSIENGFGTIQKNWSNNKSFPNVGTEKEPGFDPIIGQAGAGELLHTTMYDAEDEPIRPGFDPFLQVVTMKGGEYFFVPSLPALKAKLGRA